MRILTRIGAAAAAVLGASVVSFVFLRALPTNPARLILGRFASDDAIASLEAQLGLDRPIWEQYLRYIGSFVTGDWGYSYSSGLPVRDLILGRLPASAELAAFSFVFAAGFALLGALMVTYRRRPWLDRLFQAATAIGMSVPEFWLAVVLVVLFGEQIGWFPLPEGRLSAGAEPPAQITGMYTVDALLTGQLASFVDAVRHLVLPAIALGLFSCCYLARLLRANLLNVIDQPYLLVDRAFGRSRWAGFWRSALPHAMSSTISAAGMTIGSMIGGAVLVESVFQWPGIGTLMTSGIQTQDYAVVQAFILLTAVLSVAVNLLSDLAVDGLDPRTSLRPAARESVG